MRGAGLRVPQGGERARIIPARAGSRRRATPTPHTCRDHPRACGEQMALSVRTIESTGSSPRVRGAVPRMSSCPLWTRIIPARAGSSWSRLRAVPPGRDHPRACGEQAYHRPYLVPDLGSSPRVRGAGAYFGTFSMTPRIIPARAGSRRPSRRCRWTWWDHPRACGEQIDGRLAAHVVSGSSPRVRGAVIEQRA